MMSTTLRLSSTARTVALRDRGAGAPVVLLHGVGLQSAAWQPQIDALSKTHRVIAADLPGHGGSDPLSAGSTLPDFIEWCADLLRTLDLGPVSLVGHSMGALIAGGYATEYPDQLDRVALLNSVFNRSPSARTQVEARAAAIGTGPLDHSPPLNRWFGTAPCATRTQVATWLDAVDVNGYATAYAAFARGDGTYAARLSRITCPFLALTGADDANSTPDMSRAMAAQVPNGTAAVIDGHGHMMNLTAPALVNEHLTAWLHAAAPLDIER